MQRTHVRFHMIRRLVLLLMVSFLVMGNTLVLTNATFADQPAQIEGEWILSSNGKWWYRHTDGSYTTNGWEYINGKWYHFDSSGWMQTGWIKVNSIWYYLSDSGAMVTGWQWINGNWYYFTNSGAMVTGWQWINGDWYFFNSGGDMRTAVLYQGSRKYLFFSSGRLRSTEIQITRQQQERSNWCWAASAVMVGTYHTSVTKTQSGAVYYAKGNVENVTGTLNDTIEALFYASNYTKNGWSMGTLSYNTAASQIDANQMFIIRINWDGGGSHIVVGAGYDHNDNSLFVIDPWEDSISHYYTYYNMINGTTFQSGTGKWKYTIIY